MIGVQLILPDRRVEHCLHYILSKHTLSPDWFYHFIRGEWLLEFLAVLVKVQRLALLCPVLAPDPTLEVLDATSHFLQHLR